MSQLNDILLGETLWQEQKQQIKDLMLELINTTSTKIEDGRNGNVEWVDYEQLRQKVNDL